MSRVPNVLSDLAQTRCRNADEILPAMLHPESDAPALAEPVIEELASQAAAAPKRTPGQVTSWDASFTSPAAGWIPACSKQAHIRVLLPPAGALSSRRGACLRAGAARNVHHTQQTACPLVVAVRERTTGRCT